MQAGDRRLPPDLRSHASGWQVGAADRALSDACRDSASRGQPKAQCTSLKSNMGHLEAAAAAAGLCSLAAGPLLAGIVVVNAQLRGCEPTVMINQMSENHRPSVTQVERPPIVDRVFATIVVPHASRKDGPDWVMPS